MRIGMLSSISWRTPPRAYGPWELVTSLLTEALVARGVDVTLFATSDSITAGKLAAVAPTGYSERTGVDAKVWEIAHIANFFESADQFDLLHNQADFVPLAFSRLVPIPMVTTIHGFSSERVVPIFKRYNDRGAYVSISDADRHPELTYARTIHHGIRIEDFPFDPLGGPDLLFFGRMHRDKGAGEAVRASLRAGSKLRMAGPIQDADYFNREVGPSVDAKTVEYLGVVSGEHRARELGRARALLHLIDFNEPFGLAVIEALACGTPVIAYRRGSMPELIEHGVTGFLVDTFEDAVAAIAKIDQIDRRRCRQSAIRRFSVDRMANDYMSLYEDILSAKRGSSADQD
jgi:glycosyltransferase involved in cell wall biosynthesis